MSDSLARALAAPPPAAQPLGQQDMLARILMGNPDPGLPQYPVVQSAEGRGFAPMPTNMGDVGARMGAVLRGQVEPTPGERYGMDVPLGWVAGSGGSARDGVRNLSNEISQEVPAMIGREGGITTETIRRFFEDRNIPYRMQHSGSFSESAGPSTSQYFRVATPNEIQTVRLSDHFYPSSAAVDLRYGQPLATAEQQLADLLQLQASPQAEAARIAAQQQATKFIEERANWEKANERMINENQIIANTPLADRYRVQQELKAQREAEKKAARDARRAARRENSSGETE